MYRGNLHYRNWFLTWPGVHGALWGLPERSPWTPGFADRPAPGLPPRPLRRAQGRPVAVPARAARLWAAGAGWWLGAAAGGRERSARGSALARLGPRLAASSASAGPLAVLLYVQSFDWALPLWERFAAVRAIQAPYRLLGPAALATALAAGGALALWCRAGSGGLGAAPWSSAGGPGAVAGAAGRDVPLSADRRPPGGRRGGRRPPAGPAGDDRLDRRVPAPHGGLRHLARGRGAGLLALRADLPRGLLDRRAGAGLARAQAPSTTSPAAGCGRARG